ncbi:MAG: ABC transporter substrate-binding protein [Microbacteriaceae bacterium]
MRTHRSRLAAIAALATAAAVALAGCTTTTDSTASSAATPVEGGSVTWAVAAEPSSFAPAFHQLLSDRQVLRNLFDSLVYQESDGSFSPWLAESWTVSDDGLEYDFTIKDGITFSDGATLDAEAVKENYDYTRDADNGSVYSTLLGSVDDITADGLELTITLAQPDSSLLSALSSVALGIVDPAGLDEGDALGSPSDALSGSGPFTIESYTRGSEIVLARNDDYDWAPDSVSHDGPAYLETVTYQFVSEDSTRVGELTSGQVEVISGVPALQVSQIESTDGLEYTEGPASQSTFGFVINGSSENAPWDDVNLRKAFRDSFDLDTIVESVYQGGATRAWSWVGQDNPDYDSALEGAWGDDIDEANALLDEAGWTEYDSDGYRTKDGQRLTLTVTYDSDSIRDSRDTLIEAIQDAVKTNVGIELDFQTPTWAELSETIADGTWSVYPATFGQVNYASSVVGTWAGYFYAATAWQPTEAITAAEDALTATDETQYQDDLDTIQQYLVEDEALFVPLTESTFQIANSTSVHGLGFDYSSGSPDSNYNVWVG